VCIGFERVLTSACTNKNNNTATAKPSNPKIMRLAKFV